ALDGGDEPSLQPEPPACPHAGERRRQARVCLHPLPEGRQGAEGRLSRVTHRSSYPRPMRSSLLASGVAAVAAIGVLVPGAAARTVGATAVGVTSVKPVLRYPQRGAALVPG